MATFSGRKRSRRRASVDSLVVGVGRGVEDSSIYDATGIA